VAQYAGDELELKLTSRRLFKREGARMPEIKLPKGVWRYDDRKPLGPPGGFGAVFRGEGPTGVPVAVKRLQSRYQAREMRIADFLLGHSLAHVIPILDAGFDKAAATNFVVMPIADTSLQQRIETSAAIDEGEALKILDSIAAGLEEIGDIIHRDLKPGNVLLHDGVWKLADLGLARFAEVSTSLNTMRDALTREYAAPEQWRGERPSKATDVYALGCMMYALLHGAPPFQGPSTSDFSHQHQRVAPAGLKASPHLKRLAAACLAKSPELRHSIQSVRKQLENAAAAGKSGRGQGLAAAAAAVSEKALLEEQERLQREAENKNRIRIAEESTQVVEGIFSELRERILNDAPNAHPYKIGMGPYQSEQRVLRLGNAELQYGTIFPWKKSDTYPPDIGFLAGSRAWNVYSGAFIGVHTHVMPRKGRSANLWFGRLLEGDDYRWWEVCYVEAGLSDDKSHYNKNKTGWEPFGLKEIDLRGRTPGFVFEDPRPITPENVDSFLDRWLGWFSRLITVEYASADQLFPKRVKRRRVSPEFKLDKP
jgi:eukaryotic-like serine/threonine-protein kinase